MDRELRDGLGCRPLPSTTCTDIRCAVLPVGAATVRLDSLAAAGDSNTLVTNYYQAGPGSLRQHAALEAAVLMMEEPVFDTLRTQEQLGYSVSMTLRNTYGVLGLRCLEYSYGCTINIYYLIFSVTVNTQATKFTAEHVDTRIEEFFRQFLAEQLTEKAVNDATAALAKLKLRADVTLEEEVGRNWQEITSREFVWCRAEREAAILADLGLAEIRAELQQLLAGRKLSVQVVGSELPAGEEEGEEGEVELQWLAGSELLGDPSEWRQTLKFHPVTRITK